MVMHEQPPPPPANLHLDDDGFVRAPVELVYRRLTDVGSWGDWWPGLRIAALDAPDDDERFAATFRGSWPRRSLRVTIAPHTWQHHDRFTITCTGDLIGEGQWWLEPGWGGTVVHHWFVGGTERRNPLAVLTAYRQAVRRGLWGFKDEVQSVVRAEAGRPA